MSNRPLKMQCRKALSLCIVFAMIFGMGIFNIPQVSAADNFLYVSESGNDFSGNGSSTSPYRSIAKAAEMATPGTTVLVRAGTYIEESIRPAVSGTESAMIVFRPEKDSDVGKVIIKHNDKFDGSSITPAIKQQWLSDNGWEESQVQHYSNADIEYSIADRKNQLTDVFDLSERDFIQIEGFVFKDYKYARNSINIYGNGNVVINNRFEDIGCVPNSKWHWTMKGVKRGDVTILVSGKNNVVRNNFFQNVVGETLSYDGNSQHNIITENTFIGGIGKNSDAGGAESSTLGGRFENNNHNAFAFNYSGGSVNGGTIWLDVCVRDFVALRNVCHNTAYFMFNESGCERNWAYENIIYNKPLDANGRMPADSKYFTDFRAQKIESGLFTAFWDTGSTWDARWINNVTYNLKNGICLDRSYRDEVRNNISYEDSNSMYNPAETVGILIKETTINGFHSWHGLDLKGGGPHFIENNLWYSPRKATYVRYMEPSQPSITVDAFNAQINSTTQLAADPMFADIENYDFSLLENSPAKGSGYNGVDRGAYAIYPKTEVGYIDNMPLVADVNGSFAALNTYAKPNDIVELEIKLNKPAEKNLSFNVVPVAGDARPNKDFRFVDDTVVNFSKGDISKTVNIEILNENPDDKIDQLLALRLVPYGETESNTIGGRNLHLIKIIRTTDYLITINDIGDSMGHSYMEYHKPGDIVTIDAKTREGYVFDGWETGYHEIKLPLADESSPKTTFVMPEWNATIRAKWKPIGTVVNVTGLSLSEENISLNAGDTAELKATVSPANATDKVIIWTSSNPLVASVDKNGVVTAHSTGKADILARALENSDKQHTAVCKINVIGTITPSADGVIEAEDFTVQSGVNTEECSEGGSDVAYIENGDYIGFRNVDFKNGADSLGFRIGANESGSILEVRLGAPDGELIGSLEIESTGGWQTWQTQTCDIEKISGKQDVYFVFKGGSGYLYNLNWWSINYVGAANAGDANCDGKVTLADAAAIFQVLGNADKYSLSAQGRINADCSDVGDGITAADALAIQKLDAGILEKLPV